MELFHTLVNCCQCFSICSTDGSLPDWYRTDCRSQAGGTVSYTCKLLSVLHNVWWKTIYTADQLVFVTLQQDHNETDTCMGPVGLESKTARLLRDRRPEVSNFNVSFSFLIRTHIRYSILPALSLDGNLRLDIQNRSLFNDFFDSLLDNMNPFPGHNSAIVMDYP